MCVLVPCPLSRGCRVPVLRNTSSAGISVCKLPVQLHIVFCSAGEGWSPRQEPGKGAHPLPNKGHLPGWRSIAQRLRRSQ